MEAEERASLENASDSSDAPPPSYLMAYWTYSRLSLEYHMRRFKRNIHPVWLLSGLFWGVSSHVVISNYADQGGTLEHLWQLWCICSLLWGQFGVAALLSVLSRKKYHLFPRYLIVTLLPPVLLYLELFVV